MLKKHKLLFLYKVNLQTYDSVNKFFEVGNNEMITDFEDFMRTIKIVQLLSLEKINYYTY